MYVQTGKGSSSGGNINQDNIDIAKYITLNKFGLTPLPNRILTFLNNNDPFTVTETQNLWIFVNVIYDNNFVVEVQKIKVFKKGKGIYGAGNLQFSLSDLELVSTQSLTLGAIESNPLTQIITIEEIGNLTVSEYISQANPPIDFQNVDVAPRLIKITEIGKKADYLFLAPGGIYGELELNCDMSDFQLLNENVGDSDLEIKITDFSQLTNTELRSDKIYVLQNDIQQTSLDSIIVPTNGLTIIGGGYDVTTIKSDIPNAKLFKSAVGGCANFRLKGLSVANTGIGSQAFDLVDKNLTTHEIGFNNVNFSGCVSLGKIRNFRQVIGDDIGFYGLQDGLIFSGANNGLKLTNTNGFGWNAACTLIKKDVDTTFANRLFISANLRVPSGAILCDFISDNLLANELLQINSSQVLVNGIINADLGKDLVPNLSANDLKCKWTGNSGIPNSAIENLVENTNVSGYYNIDWLKQTYLLTMTGDTEFTESNLPANGKNTQEIKIYLQGDFLPIFPADWIANAVGTYKRSDLNEITLKFLKTGVYFMKIDNSLSVYPKPSLQSLAPTSLLPSTTASLTINGSFFTPETIVSIENQTVNSVEFVNQGQLILSVTTSAVEEEVDITISNGTTVVFSGVLPINLGVVFIPVLADWENITGTADFSKNGEVSVVSSAVNGNGIYNKIIDFSKDWIVSAKTKISPFASLAGGGSFSLIDAVTNAGKVSLISDQFCTVNGFYIYNNGDYITQIVSSAPYKIEFRYIGGVLRIYMQNVLKYTFSVLPFSGDLKLQVGVTHQDFYEIKYIELP